MKRKNILSLILVGLYALTLFSGCAQNNNNSSSPGSNDSSGGNIVSAKEYKLIENGESKYTIVVPDDGQGGEDNGAKVLSQYIYQATACSLNIVTESNYDSNIHKNAISLGETKLYENTELNVDIDALNSDGYVIKNVGENIYVIAGESVLAYQYAAYRLLNEFIDFEAYSYDEIYYKSSNNVVYEELDILDVPDFAVRQMYNGDIRSSLDSSVYKQLLRNNQTHFSSIGGAHTIFKLLPVETYYELHNDWYVSTDPTNGQLCFSKQDMLEELAKRVIEEVKNSEDATHIMVGQNDGRDWCICKDCAASLRKYGTNSAVLIKGINYIAGKVQEYVDEYEPGRKVRVCTFAYTSTEVPPVKTDANGNMVPIDDSVKVADNVSIRLAPIDTNYARSYYDWENESYAKNIKGWGALAKEVIIWNYNTNFNFLFVPFCNWNSIQDNYKFLKSCNVNAVMEQCAYAAKQIVFMPLKNYLYSKLMWDNNLDFEGLINNFFENYFREGSQYMKKYFDEYRSWYNVIEKEHNRVSGSVYAGYGSIEDVFPLRLMDRWEGYVDQAKQEIEYLKDINPDLYQKLYERMDLETLFFDSVRLFWYETSYSDGQLLQMRLSFKERCEKYQLTHFSEGKTLASTYANWGI